MRKNKKRLRLVFTIILLLFVIIAFRLFQLQIVDYQKIQNESTKLLQRNFELKAERGDIVDRNGAPLAYSKEQTALYYHKNLSEDVDAEIDLLFNSYSAFDVEEVKTKIKESEAEKLIIIDDVDADYIDVVRALEPPAFRLQKRNVRIYPNGSLASQILGFTEMGGKGINGIEYSCNDYLAGKSGGLKVKTDRDGRRIASAEPDLEPAINGNKVVLTIDSTIQLYLEKAIKAGFEVSNADKVMAIMQDARNGDILAMASFPDYDPNKRLKAIYDVQESQVENKTEEQSDYDIMSKYWRNPVVEELYEPGSTFKIFTGMLGLEENATYNDKQYYCAGSKDVTGVNIRCWFHSGHGEQNLVRGFQNSCNVVFMDVIGAIGAKRTYDYIKAFQLDKKSDIKLNGEASPLLTPLDKLQPVDLARIGFGHNVSLTPLQMMKVLSVVASGGELYQPRLVKAIYDENGDLIEEFPVRAQGQVISSEVANNVLHILESVVTDGSGRNAYIPGYRIAGKTGTSVKIINGQYLDESKVYSSFAAIVPVDKPRFNLLVIVDEPKTKNIHGSTVATPIAREIISNVLHYLKIDPADNLQHNMVSAPQIIGKTLQQAKIDAESLGITLVNNNGGEEQESDLEKMIVKQYPLSGTLISSGSGTIYYELQAE